MKIYKFGGASVRTAEGVRNLCRIVSEEKEPIFIVISAMGKTTNALEEVLDHCIHGRSSDALNRASEIIAYHEQIIDDLFGQAKKNENLNRTNAPIFHTDEQSHPHTERNATFLARPALETLYSRLSACITSIKPDDDFDRAYDMLVSFGELISTTIVSNFLEAQGIDNRWIDMRACLITDDRFREATVDLDASGIRLKTVTAGHPVHVFIGQGFIGGTLSGEPTTLGREGSDYTAAIVGNLLEAEQVTIWKDVDGILNADPRRFDDAVLIPELTYLDAIELAYSGAQIIHPKTIKPLQNKNIPLYVRPFGDSSKPGSVIRNTISKAINVPVRILKSNQILITIRPKDFSFVLEERLAYIFYVFHYHRVKINLIQSSAVSLSLSVDNSRLLGKAVEILRNDFRVAYNDHMELITIRGYDANSYARYAKADGIFLVQRTRRTLRILRRSSPDESR